MQSYIIKLKRSTTVAEGTMAFSFEKPRDFSFRAGQYVDVMLLDPPETDAGGNVRAFSIAAAPYEEDLMFVTRMRDKAFKRSLAKMAPGGSVQISGPQGSFVLHDNPSVPAVFLVGGIGITPVLSILRQAAYQGLPHHLTLFYANRRPKDAAFLDELREMEAAHRNFRLIATMTRAAESKIPWTGETSRIGRPMLTRYIDDLTGPLYYVVGPLDMVDDTNGLLGEMGIDQDNIEFEEFPGY